MMKYYSYRCSVWKDGVEIDRNYTGPFLQEETENKTFEVSWDDLEHFARSFKLPYEIWKAKRGMEIVFFHGGSSIKQWKEPNLKLTIKIEYNEDKYVSIQKILGYPNAEKAIQYLKERGLSIAVN